MYLPIEWHLFCCLGEAVHGWHKCHFSKYLGFTCIDFILSNRKQQILIKMLSWRKLPSFIYLWEIMPGEIQRIPEMALPQHNLALSHSRGYQRKMMTFTGCVLRKCKENLTFLKSYLG